MNEHDFRTAILAEAKLWLGTPYKNTGRMRGVGANCAQLLYGIYKGAGILPPDAPEPRWYSSQLHVHQKEERLIEYIKSYGGIEIEQAEVKPADVIVFHTGKSHGHAAIVVDFPGTMIHTMQPQGCAFGHCTKEGQLQRFGRRYFTLWKS